MFSIGFKRIVAVLVVVAAIVGVGCTIAVKAASADWSTASSRVRQVEDMSHQLCR
ncbi:MAG: hypothetical protein LLG01_17140 [Planctomycetaceae bacterium]|nr:hypothetical protein [Planctomycetaceae bacterium]